MDKVINLKLHEYSIFYYYHNVYTEGMCSAQEIEKSLEQALRTVNDIEIFLNIMAKESKDYLHFYDYIGTLEYLRQNYPESNKSFEKARKFKEKMLTANIINEFEFNRSILISMYNMIEV